MNVEQETPAWLKDEKVNEVLFSIEFLATHPMCCINGTFFTVDGRLSDENQLRKEIYNLLKPHIHTKLVKNVSNLLEVLRMESCSQPMPLEMDRIHVQNGTLFLDGHFSEEKEFCRNRLAVAYNPDAPKPERWLEFLDQLLEPEDIPTLQEYMGYCFLPTTKAQKMLFLIGDGGEGKSRIGLVMLALMGNCMLSDSIAKVEHSPFARADLENRLLMVDDDMKLETLKHSNNIKAIVTAELPMDLEKKGMQSYQGDMYARLMVFANGTMQSIQDKSNGFFRRQIILTVKKKPLDRVDNPFLAERLQEEKEGIFLWCLEGLSRLLQNNYKFTLSEQALQNVEEAMAGGNNIVDFMKSEGYFQFRADYETSTKAFYDVYIQWCADNAVHPQSAKAFSSYLRQKADCYKLEYTNKVNIGGNKFARGYMGIQVFQHAIF